MYVIAFVVGLSVKSKLMGRICEISTLSDNRFCSRIEMKCDT